MASMYMNTCSGKNGEELQYFYGTNISLDVFFWPGLSFSPLSIPTRTDSTRYLNKYDIRALFTVKPHRIESNWICGNKIEIEQNRTEHDTNNRMEN